jgi:hypothetical protein
VVNGATRRALLATGAAGLLAGCGAEANPGEARAALLAEQLQAERATAAAYAGLPGREVARLRARAHARVQTLQAALRSAGAAPPPVRAASGRPSLERALAAESAALRAHVAATGRTADPALRALLADLVTGAAEGEALLRRLLGRDPLAGAFPGQAL